jgi:hypothetical protein
MMTLSVAFPAVSAAFLGALVEAVEAVTIVLAIATVRGWRSAGTGALAGLIALMGGMCIVGRLSVGSVRQCDRRGPTPSISKERRIGAAHAAIDAQRSVNVLWPRYA